MPIISNQHSNLLLLVPWIRKIVQEAACSALSSFIEESDASLIEFYLEPLLHHFAKCFQVYQRKNLVILYDCVQTFVEKWGMRIYH